MKRISLRYAQPEDWPEIQRVHAEQQAAQGTNYGIPYLWGPHIAVALVGERDGKIVQALYVERVAEMCFIGADPKGTAFARREIDGLAWILKGMKYRWLHCLVPKQLADAIAKPLKRAGFVSKEKELVAFSRSLLD